MAYLLFTDMYWYGSILVILGVAPFLRLFAKLDKVNQFASLSQSKLDKSLVSVQ